MKYKLAVGGGTFDHFHTGHEAFLLSMLGLSEHILLGITSDEYLQLHKKYAESSQSYVERKGQVLDFLKGRNLAERVTIARIESTFYPEAWEQLPIEASIVTDGTIKGAEIINISRQERGLAPLKIEILPLVYDSKGRKLSSANIRAGDIDRRGNPYMRQMWLSSDLFLPEGEKHWFKEPFGKLYTDVSSLKNELIKNLVTVGDTTTENCNTIGLQQKLSVIDFKTHRQKSYKQIRDLGFDGNVTIIYADNPAGHITHGLNNAIMQATGLLSQKKRIIIIVNGEEDLAVIPLVLMLPLGYSILYGQPNAGVVKLKVTMAEKTKASNLLDKFRVV